MTYQMVPGMNTGFIPSLPTLSDFQVRGETGAIVTAINPTADWRSFESPGEWQRITGGGFETDACVSFSANDTLETYGNFSIAAGKWPDSHIQWLKDKGYFNPDGTLNFSDRFTAKMSGTTPNGNTLPAVWDSTRHNGLVPEKLWPFPVSEILADPSNAWPIYYAQPTPDLVALGQEFASKFEVTYEWVAFPGAALTPAQFADDLKVAPIQIATAVCPPWNTSDIINACGPGSAHATMLSYVETGVSYHILDHYVPFDKRFSIDYSLTYAMRATIAPKIPQVVQPFRYTFNTNLAYGAPVSADVKALQQALQYLKDRNGNAYMKAGVFGPFGPQTAAALSRFQADMGVQDAPPGYHFGPRSRAAMNARLAS